ncbi:MAG: hypothetical protein OIF50_06590 [Flavobacteriaceae bacterium]|nr:hypothetical protein [Flavobacteriaceae bacterium]
MKNFIYLLIVLFCSNANAQFINDASYLDSEFFQFKNELLSCVIKKDTTKLKEFLAETIFDGTNGCDYPGCSKEEFIQHYLKKRQKDHGVICSKSLGLVL